MARTERDEPPGLQAGDPAAATERTRLAWQRTALALVLGGAVMLRFGTELDLPAVAYPASALLLAAAIAAWFNGRRTERRRRAGADGDLLARPRALAMIAAATAVTAAAGFLLALAPAWR